MNSSSSISNVSSILGNGDSPSLSMAKSLIIQALGLSINYINCALIHTFRKHQVFYMNPRYILFIHLVVNDMIQLTTTISLYFVSYSFYKINVSVCCFVVTFVVFTTLNTPMNLAVMAVERYIAVCFPLRHAELCTVRRTYILIVCIWVLSVFSFMPDIFLTLATEPQWLLFSSVLCDRDTLFVLTVCIWVLSSLSIMPDVFLIVATEPQWLFFSTLVCDRDNLFRHPVSLKKRDVTNTIFFIAVWLTLIFTYIKIFFVAKAANSADGKAKKARNTILLHGFQLLLCMLTYVHNIIKNALVYLFPKYYLHVIFVCYILIQILPRFVSPIVYGLRDNVFKQHLKKYLLCGIKTGNKPMISVKFGVFSRVQMTLIRIGNR